MSLLRLWAPPFLYMALIWTLSSMSGLRLDLAKMPHQDKWAHVIEYGGLGFLLYRAFSGTYPTLSARKWWLMSLTTAFGWGLLDELHQALVPRRTSEVWDLVADTVGAALGALTFGLLKRYGAHLRPSKTSADRT